MAADDFWTPLLGAREGGGVPLTLRVLRKRGRAFLALPRASRAALTALSLYPAQTPRARAARSLLGWLLRFGIPAGTSTVTVAVSPQDPFVAFLASLAAAAAGGIPPCGVLAGNPGNEGRRFVLLVFDPSLRPAAVVKAGLGPPARALVQKEAAFLQDLAGRTPGVPRLRDVFAGERADALALDFFPGESPRPRHLDALPALLGPWVDTQRTLVLEAAPDWGRLAEVGAAESWWPVLLAAARHRAVHPAIGHGDLTPWNIRVAPGGGWTVLDWERGERDGIPGWDWFHYVVQVGILVDHLPTSVLVDRVEALLSSETFRRYAGRSGILGFERDLMLAYLLHSAQVIKPSEGLPQTRELMRALAGRWRGVASAR